MSGGHFDYKQFRIEEIADSVETYLNGEEVDDITEYEKEYKKGWVDKETLDYIKENKRTVPNQFEYSNDTLREMKQAVIALRRAFIYAQRIDYLLSGDDSEESFHRRLKDELHTLNRKIFGL